MPAPPIILSVFPKGVSIASNATVPTTKILILFFLPFLSFSQPVFFAGGEMAFWFDEESSNFGIGPSLGLNFILGQSPVSISGKTAIIYYI